METAGDRDEDLDLRLLRASSDGVEDTLDCAME